MRRTILIPTLRLPKYVPTEQEKSDLVSMLNRLGAPKMEAKKMVETLIPSSSFEGCVKTLLKALRVS